MSGIKDVAKLAGVSISTVSNVINKTRPVSEELTKKVLSAAEALSYSANPIAQGMKNSKTGLIGVLVEDMCGVFYPYIVKGIDAVASENNYQLSLCDAGGVTGKASAFDREKELILRLVESRVDGILLVSTASEADKPAYSKWLKKVTGRYKYTPIVSIERDFSEYGIDSVYYDCYNNTTTAVNHLIQCGCKHIGCISGPESLQISQERTASYKACLRKNNLPFDERKQIFTGNYTHSGGYSAMKRLLDNYPEIDGVFSQNDQMAMGALKCLKMYGIKIPEDIKLIGYDDIFFSSLIEPSLSTIHIPKKHMGIEAATILFERIAAQDSSVRKPVCIKMPGRLVVRRSTVENAPEDWILTDW